MDVPKANAHSARFLSGRVRRGNEAKYQIVIDHYAKTGRLIRACETAGIDYTAHWRRMQSDPKYRAAIEEAEQSVAQEVEDSVYDMAIAGEGWAATLLLRRFRPQHYRERAAVEISVDLVDRMKAADERLVIHANADPDADR